MREIEEFQNFITDMELVDLPVVGKRFSCFKSDGSAMSRLDRFLFTQAALKLWGFSEQWILDRNVSDHCPIMVQGGVENWGPKPFRFNNCWLLHPKFKGWVEEEWKKPHIQGTKLFVFREKLKCLKQGLGKWNREEFGSLDNNIKTLEDQLNSLDAKAIEGVFGEAEHIEKKECMASLWLQWRMKENLIFQKSRSRWVKEGDANTSYFHAYVNGRRRHNQILALLGQSGWVSGVEGVREEIMNYFSGVFSDPGVTRPKLDGVSFSTLNQADNDDITKVVSAEEIKETVWNCRGGEGGKSSGLDGFNFGFIKEYWYVLQEEVVSAVKEFFMNKKLPRSVSSSFIALIPKRLHPQAVEDFRPISLIGCIQKTISKVLSNRLKTVLGKVISKSQSAFISGRQILDGVLLVNEVVDSAKKSKKDCMILKVDFEKAYDSVSWDFLDYKMRRLGFSTT